MAQVLNLKPENAQMALRIQSLTPVVAPTRAGGRVAIVPARLTSITERKDQYAEVRIAGHLFKVVLDMTFDEAVAALSPDQ